ncbi:aminoacyl-tRNA hydrolase [Myxococcota bacterium]|nr:aminoacyl-tRNA hydrolase [Myxococcota bacterium]MBU1899082.1 aminoacyl-tRNA hydrolase [Myxococcota bacterium]
MDQDLFIDEGLTIPAAALAFTASRSSGPGGQHVNKTHSRITLRWDPSLTPALMGARRARVLARLASRINAEGILFLHVEEARSQHQNREIARARLAALIQRASLQPKRRLATKPSRAAKQRRLAAKSQRGEIKRGRQRPGVDD